jgi:hypothetical protein
MKKNKKTYVRRKTRHFTAKDVGRVTAYARRDGADDAVLAKYIISAMGMGEVPCIISEVMLLASSAVLWFVVFKLVRGLIYIVEGLNTLTAAFQEISWTGTFFYELIATIEVEFGIEITIMSKAQWLIWIGSIQATLASMILFFDSYQDTIVYFRMLDKVCQTKIERKPFPIPTLKPDFDFPI